MTKTCTITLTTVAITLGACSSSSSSGVPWGDYDPTVRTRIDSMTVAKDCAGLQDEFNTADAGNTVTMNRTGHNNAALMSYINDGMQSAGC
jgi:hypothetical protein